jgi:hypothetical protein
MKLRGNMQFRLTGLVLAELVGNSNEINGLDSDRRSSRTSRAMSNCDDWLGRSLSSVSIHRKGVEGRMLSIPTLFQSRSILRIRRS